MYNYAARNSDYTFCPCVVGRCVYVRVYLCVCVCVVFVLPQSVLVFGDCQFSNMMEMSVCVCLCVCVCVCVFEIYEIFYDVFCKT